MLVRPQVDRSLPFAFLFDDILTPAGDALPDVFGMSGEPLLGDAVVTLGGYSTAYVGSSNLSKSALLDGLEWNVRFSAVEQGHLLDTFRATFDEYWEDPSFESYDPTVASQRARLDEALAAEGGGPTVLRPTESATVFLQQLGLGLRLADDKPCLTVLDFIGNRSREFRFDLRCRPLTGTTRRGLQR